MDAHHLPHVLTVPTKACLLCATPADMDLHIYRSMPEGSYRAQSLGFVKIVYQIAQEAIYTETVFKN